MASHLIGEIISGGLHARIIAYISSPHDVIPRILRGSISRR